MLGTGRCDALYCTVRVTTFPCAVPPTAVAATVICEVPSGVAATRFTKPVPGDCARADVAVTETVAGFVTAAGELYNPVWSTVPLLMPPVTAQVTFWLEEPFTVALNCC